MALEIIRGEDARIVLSQLKQTAYGTRLTDANLNAGKSIRLNTATFGEITARRAGEGPRPMTGHEWPDGSKEVDILRDSGIGLAFDMNSFMAGWAAAFFFGQVTSVQEGLTTHYTHTFRPTNPLSSSGRQPPTTSIYTDTNGPDAGRLRRVLQDLATASFTISWRAREMAAMAIELIGSGREVTTPTITIPALSTFQEFPATAVKFEYGAKGGALTDIIERVKECSLRCTQVLASDDGYTPGSGKFRNRIWFTRRSFSIDVALFADRANRDLIDDMLGLTRKEIKVTIDSGVRAGTSTTTNHQVIARYPDVRISESPLNPDDPGAVYAVRVGEDQVYRDTTVTDTPCTLTVDNDQASYLT